MSQSQFIQDVGVSPGKFSQNQAARPDLFPDIVGYLGLGEKLVSPGAG
jgi:hypothetical protein